MQLNYLALPKKKKVYGKIEKKEQETVLKHVVSRGVLTNSRLLQLKWGRVDGLYIRSWIGGKKKVGLLKPCLSSSFGQTLFIERLAR